MPTAFSRPILIREDGSSQALNQVPVTHKGHSQYDEAWLQRLLYQHPGTLPISEIDDSFSGLIPLCMEMDTPAGPIDIVYITPSGRLALLEAKLWRNPEARRKVVGQILDYATKMISWDYSRLDSAVRNARRREDRNIDFPGILDHVRRQGVAVEEHTFIDAVTKSLTKGDFLLLIAGDGIREGVGAIAQFLDRTATMHFTLGLIECAVYEAPGGAHLIQPRVLAQTTVIPRTVVMLGERLVEAENQPAEAADDVDDPDASEYRAKHQAYWTEFLNKVRLEESQRIPKAGTSTNIYFQMPRGSEGWVSAYLAQSKGRAGVYLTFQRGKVGEELFEALEKDKGAINDAIGLPVTWEKMGDGRQRVIAMKHFGGDLMTDSRTQSQDWLVDVTQRFVSVFRPRIEALLREHTTGVSGDDGLH